MNWLQSLKTNWLYGKASSKMRREKFEEAIDVFQMLLKYERKNNPANPITFFEIGYCYYKCNDCEQALFWFAKSYEEFYKQDYSLYIKPFYYLTIYYAKLLNDKGDSELSQQVLNRAKDIFGIDNDGNLIIP
jgi:outer membrane protein assembly factor BamD (BamD/ComL family)